MDSFITTHRDYVVLNLSPLATPQFSMEIKLYENGISAAYINY
jgi:hypothetical protein